MPYRDKVYQQLVTADQSEIKVHSSIIGYEIETILVRCPFRPRNLTYL